MNITTTRSVIDIGTSKGITLPAKELRRLGVDTGDEVKVVLTVVKKPVSKSKIPEEYDSFVQQYGETLKNLADR